MFQTAVFEPEVSWKDLCNKEENPLDHRDLVFSLPSFPAGLNVWDQFVLTARENIE